MKITSYPPNQPRPTSHDAARHIAEEARLVLASLRGGPPYIARGELAYGLRQLRSTIRSQFLDENNNTANNSMNVGLGSESYYTNASAAASFSPPPVITKTTPRAEDKLEVDKPSASPQIRVPPPVSPNRSGETQGDYCNELQMKNNLPPPPLPTITTDGKATNEEEDKSKIDNNQEEDFEELSSSPTQMSPPTPHSVPPLSLDTHETNTSTISIPPPLLPMLASTSTITESTSQLMQQQRLSSSNPKTQSTTRNANQQQSQQQQQSLDPGPYATPFLAVIIDPRAAGPHTLVALRALHRLLERGSIVQLTLCAPTATSSSSSNHNNSEGSITDATAKSSSSRGSSPLIEQFIHETALEPIARGVLACRFEQTDAGADEAVEMAIADLLQLLIELDAAGARNAESVLLRQVYLSKKEKASATERSSQTTTTTIASQPNQPQQQISSISSNQESNNKTRKTGTLIKIQRLPSSILMEAFHAVFITRHTFVHDGGGHHSPALSFHFEQVLLRIIHCVFGKEDEQSTLGKNKSWNSVMSSKHLGGARRILEFLVDSLSLRKKNNNNGNDTNTDKRNSDEVIVDDDGRTLCLRLIQCCLRTGWGGCPVSIAEPEDQVLIHLIEDDLCLALLTTGQAIWSHHDEMPSSASDVNDMLVNQSGTTSLELLSEVCATFSLLWNLPKLRIRLRSQFAEIFSGFYQRALSLLRKRPLPEDGMIYQSNMIFDMEVEVILESLVDILGLSRCDSGTGGCSKSLSTIEELFLTYDCSVLESDVASGLIVQLSRCCGGTVDEEGEPYLPSMPPSRTSTNIAPTPKSNESELGSASPIIVVSHRSVPDHLKELCFEALLGSLKRLFHGVESLEGELNGGSNTTQLRTTKNTKRLFHHAAKLFNDKPKLGLKYLVDNGALPNPPDAKSVASFLRNGLVVGLDKAAIGQFLGELGKGTKDIKATTPLWETSDFHKDVLIEFCSSFTFKHQTILDGLRMFLSSFRLPGEAQMIDRILQAFSEAIACVCKESTNGLFSSSDKKSADAAYLLSFSIIMLNTDLHNDNIRLDRKMKLVDFIRNNKNYGNEISDKDLPETYLEGIYNAIKTEQIRTLGEGADGSMTVERWECVMRSASSFQLQQEQSLNTVKDLKELLLESTWQPLLSAVAGLWGLVPLDSVLVTIPDQAGTMMGSRLGIDLSCALLSGAGDLNRVDIFQDLFTNICYMSGLLGEYNTSNERADNFMKSLEHQSSFTVAMNIAEEYGNLIGLDGWKCVWASLFELRDLQLLSGKVMKESDSDLLSPEARDNFSRRMTNWDEELHDEGQPHKSGGGLMSFVFGSTGSLEKKNSPINSGNVKANLLVWNDIVLSDEKEDHHNSTSDTNFMSFPSTRALKLASIGASFENQFVYEAAAFDSEEIGVTGLERIDSSYSNSKSLMVRVRHRLSHLIDFYSVIAESRYLSEEGLSDELNALVEIIRDSSLQGSGTAENDDWVPLSPASEAFAEVLLCEIALKNRDRLALVWDTILRPHYNSRLTYRPSRAAKTDEDGRSAAETIRLTPGIEKCVTSILRLCIWTTNRSTAIANEVLPTLKILHPPCTLIWSPLLELNLDKHLAEGLWRIAHQNTDSLSQINDDSLSAILDLLEWCAMRGGLPSGDPLGSKSLAEDDPSLQAFKSLHLILHDVNLKDSLRVEHWPKIVASVRCLVEAGERAMCPKLSIAGLDLLQLLLTRMEPFITNGSDSQLIIKCWVPILEAIAEPGEKSRNGVSFSCLGCCLQHFLF